MRSPEPSALPLVVTHGWPGSIAEFMEIIGPLTDPAAHGGDPADAFHVVAPSIPGYGFSGPTNDTGWNVPRIARAFAELMARLGYDRYGAQGGDWGSMISRTIGIVDPDHVVAIHLNMLAAVAPGTPEEIAALSDEDKAKLQSGAHYMAELSGYMQIQSTRPQTLSYGLTDSPVGQLAWIAEKFKDWTDSESSPDDAVDRDQLLTNVMLYWLTGTAGSSARLYYETRHGGGFGTDPMTVPIGVANFAKEIMRPVRQFAERANTIVQWSEFDRGGHFAAMEEPDLLVGDVRQLFRRFSLTMCRNITTLRGLQPPATAEEIEAGARQYVRKISGVQKTSVATEAAFEQAVREITEISTRLLAELPPRQQPPPTEPPLRRRAKTGAAAGAS